MMEKPEFERLTQSVSLRRLREALSGGVSRPIWWEIPEGKPRKLDYSVACRTCRFVRESGTNRGICQARFLEALAEAHRKGRAVQFICPIQRYAVCFPLARSGRVEGHVALCHSETAFPQRSLDLGTVALQAALREEERTEELKVLSESIQPRCVALSTIHTIHRLISSTLNLEELLPRIARLCCQVLRAQNCSIWLLEKDRHTLTPRAVIEVGRKGAARKKEGLRSLSFRPFRIGRGLVGQVASSCRSHFSDRVMAAPLVEEECVGVLMVQRKDKGRPFASLDQEILTTLAEQAVVAVRNAQMYESQERVTWGTIRSLSAILDGMDPYTPARPSRTKLLAEVALSLAREMQLPTTQQRSIEYAALLHDAGRLGIPENILHKPAKLEPAEFALVKEHAVRGARLLQPLEILEPAVPIILHHHERYDGTGYPKGLKKEAIPIGARILAVANAFEAMIFDRPYRKAMTVDEAAREIASYAGTQFDPKVVEAFLGLVRSKRFPEVMTSP